MGLCSSMHKLKIQKIESSRENEPPTPPVQTKEPLKLENDQVKSEKIENEEENEEKLTPTRPQRKMPEKLEKTRRNLEEAYHAKAARVERKETAMVNRLVREARKVAKKKKKVEHRAHAKSQLMVKTICVKNEKQGAENGSENKKTSPNRRPQRIKTDAMKEPNLTSPFFVWMVYFKDWSCFNK